MGTGGEDDSFMKFWAEDKNNLPSITHAIRAQQLPRPRQS
jgi:hypothetical protein